MKQTLLIGSVLVGLILAVLLLVGGPRQTLRSLGDARVLAALPQVPIAPILQPGDPAPDLVVFQDGDDGWFELDVGTLPPDLSIGFHGPRLFDVFTGNSHIATYCGGTGPRGKIIWTIRDGEIADDYAFCNPRRMDLAPLRAFARAVEMVEQDLARDEVLALLTRIDADPLLAEVSFPSEMSELTHRRIITTPITWFLPDAGPARFEIEAAIDAAVTDHIGQSHLFFTRRPASNPNLALNGLDPTGTQVPQVTGMAVRIDGRVAVLDGVWSEPYVIWVDCLPEACARLDTLDLAPLLAPGRDLDGLRRTLETSMFLPEGHGGAPPETFPSLDELEDPTIIIGEMRPVSYLTRHIIRPPIDAE